MDTTDCRSKFKELLFDAMLTVAERMESILVQSGAINLDDYTNNYRLPKILLHDALKYTAELYEPIYKEDKQTAKNLENF